MRLRHVRHLIRSRDDSAASSVRASGMLAARPAWRRSSRQPRGSASPPFGGYALSSSRTRVLRARHDPFVALLHVPRRSVHSLFPGRRGSTAGNPQTMDARVMPVTPCAASPTCATNTRRARERSPHHADRHASPHVAVRIAEGQVPVRDIAQQRRFSGRRVLLVSNPQPRCRGRPNTPETRAPKRVL